jgi:hypothetical protein
VVNFDGVGDAVDVLDSDAARTSCSERKTLYSLAFVIADIVELSQDVRGVEPMIPSLVVSGCESRLPVCVRQARLRVMFGEKRLMLKQRVDGLQQ